MYSHIEKEAGEKIDFKIQSNRTQSIDRFCAAHTSEKRGSVSAAFSKQMEKYCRANNLNAADYRQKSKIKAKFDTSMNPSITHKPADVQAPTIQNPQAAGGPPRPMAGGIAGAPPGAEIMAPISEGAVKSFTSATYGVARLASKNMGNLTDSEADDLASLWHPVISMKATTLRARALLAIGGTAGILAKKWRDGQKEASEKKKEEPNPIQKPVETSMTGAPTTGPAEPAEDPKEDPYKAYRGPPDRGAG